VETILNETTNRDEQVKADHVKTIKIIKEEFLPSVLTIAIKKPNFNFILDYNKLSLEPPTRYTRSNACIQESERNKWS
jgi:hypothetical protein